MQNYSWCIELKRISPLSFSCYFTKDMRARSRIDLEMVIKIL